MVPCADKERNAARPAPPAFSVHTCAPKSDFRKRKAAYEQEQRDKACKKRERAKHDYTNCPDKECKRPLCVAYKTGWKSGAEDG